jgi:hypothetical protein
LLPVAVTVILPVAGVAHGMATEVVELTKIFTPTHGLASSTVNCFEPVHPLLSFATTVYVPFTRFENVPDDWKAPPLILKVKFVLPLAVAAILPLVAPGPVASVMVPVTAIVTPAQGLGGGGVLPPPLLHEIIKMQLIIITISNALQTNNFMMNFYN